MRTVLCCHVLGKQHKTITPEKITGTHQIWSQEQVPHGRDPCTPIYYICNSTISSTKYNCLFEKITTFLLTFASLLPLFCYPLFTLQHNSWFINVYDIIMAALHMYSFIRHVLYHFCVFHWLYFGFSFIGIIFYLVSFSSPSTIQAHDEWTTAQYNAAHFCWNIECSRTLSWYIY